MSAPICPNCGNEITRVVDVPYGWWEWNAEKGKYVHTTATGGVDVAPWVHTDCMTMLRNFHPQNPVVPA